MNKVENKDTTFFIASDVMDFTWEVNEMNDFFKKNGFDFPSSVFEQYCNIVVERVRDLEDLHFEWGNCLDSILDDCLDDYQDDEEYEDYLDMDKFSKVLNQYSKKVA